MLETWVKSMRPGRLLDVGCGRRRRSEALSAHCPRIVAIDASPSLIPRWRELHRPPAVAFCCMVEEHLVRSDRPVGFQEFFSSFGIFAARSRREAYWLGKLEALRRRFDGLPLCEDDRLMVLAEKKTAGSKP
jgi:hypothetical protein